MIEPPLLSTRSPQSYTPITCVTAKETQSITNTILISFRKAKAISRLPDKIAFGSDQLKFRFPQGVFVYARRNLLRRI